MSFRTDAGSILATPFDRPFDRKNARSVRVFEYPRMGASDGFRYRAYGQGKDVRLLSAARVKRAEIGFDTLKKKGNSISGCYLFENQNPLSGD